jgi:hypothetical protein
MNIDLFIKFFKGKTLLINYTNTRNVNCGTKSNQNKIQTQIEKITTNYPIIYYIQYITVRCFQKEDVSMSH